MKGLEPAVLKIVGYGNIFPSERSCFDRGCIFGPRMFSLHPIFDGVVFFGKK
jgi:hypothetical protein